MLTSKQIAYLKSEAHHLKPIMQIGKDGLSNNSFITIQQALKKHELIKISVLKTVEEEKKALILDICARLHAHFIFSIGRTLIFYKKGEANYYGL